MGEPVYFGSIFAGIPMLISEITTERGRDVAVQSPAQGDTHTLTNQGKKHRVAKCEILFLDQPGQDSYTDRYDEFVKRFEDGNAYILSHPLDGQYTVQGGVMEASASSASMSIRVNAEFLHEQEAPAVFPVAAGVTGQAGVESVSAAVARTTNVLDEFELESSVPAAALAEVEAWSEADVLDSQTVFLGVGSVTQQIDEAIATLGLREDLSLWQPYREMVLLRYEVSRAAQAFTSDAATVFDLFVDQPRPLLAICAEIYGGAEARDKYEQVKSINRVRTPGRVPAGTTLKMPSLGAV